MSDDNTLTLNGEGKGYGLGEVAQSQIVERMRPTLPGIRKEYWDGMAEIPGLRAYTVNAWLGSVNERRLVRTLDGNVRAFLSDEFQTWDNADMLAGILPVLGKYPLRVKSCSLTERRMYLQVVFPDLTGEVKVGDAVRAGLTFTNSEVGSGKWDVRSFLEVLRCMNGAVGESLVSRRHVGRQIEGEDGLYRRDTIESDIRTAKLMLRDVVEGSLDRAKFLTKLDLLKGAASDGIANPVALVERVTKRFDFSDAEGANILNNLVKGGESTRWGLSNAVTAMAHTIENPDRQYEIERAGWDVVALSKSDWQVLNN
jgi:hypothetical protein